MKKKFIAKKVGKTTKISHKQTVGTMYFDESESYMDACFEPDEDQTNSEFMQPMQRRAKLHISRNGRVEIFVEKQRVKLPPEWKYSTTHGSLTKAANGNFYYRLMFNAKEEAQIPAAIKGEANEAIIALMKKNNKL